MPYHITRRCPGISNVNMKVRQVYYCRFFCCFVSVWTWPSGSKGMLYVRAGESLLGLPRR